MDEALGGLQRAADEPQHGGLSDAVGAHDGEAALQSDPKVDVPEQPGTAGVGKVHIREAQHGRGHCRVRGLCVSVSGPRR